MENGEKHLAEVVVIIPTLNESLSIGKVLFDMPKELLERVMLVDSSNDATPKIAQNFGVKVIPEPRRGYGRAYKTGFSEAKGDIIVTLDGDSSYPPGYIPKLVSILVEKQLDFITTNRFKYMESGAMNPIHKLGNCILSLVIRALFGINISDSQSGMWCFYKRILREVMPSSDGMSFSEELKIRAFLRLKTAEIPVPYRKRTGRHKLKTFRHGLQNLLYLLMLRARMSLRRKRGKDENYV